MKPYERHNARIYALQALYAWLVSKNCPQEIEEDLHEEFTWKKVDIPYFKELFYGVIEQANTIDELMMPYLDRPFPQLSPVELTAMRLAIYELKNRLDVPYRVVINEALELTKQFGNAEGFKFVNGILDCVAKVLRKAEIQGHH